MFIAKINHITDWLNTGQRSQQIQLLLVILLMSGYGIMHNICSMWQMAILLSANIAFIIACYAINGGSNGKDFMLRFFVLRTLLHLVISILGQVLFLLHLQDIFIPIFSFLVKIVGGFWGIIITKYMLSPVILLAFKKLAIKK